MAPDYSPSIPTVGGRVYKRLTARALTTRASDQPSGYTVGAALQGHVNDNLDPGDMQNLDEAGIDAFGFELEVDATAGNSQPFPSVSGAIGLSLVWLPSAAADGRNTGPFVYVFADYTKSGPTAIGDTPVPATRVEGCLFAGHFVDGTVRLTPTEWEQGLEAAGAGKDVEHSGGLLSGELTLAVGDDSIFSWGQRSLWNVFVAELDFVDMQPTYQVRASTYAHDEWLLATIFGQQPGADPVTPPEHTFWENGTYLIPAWNSQESGQPTLTGIDGLGEYGGAPLHIDTTGRPADVSQLHADLWTLGFRIRGMVDDSSRDPGDRLKPSEPSKLMTGDASSTFSEQTAWALREFQIYASGGHVAKETDSSTDRYVDGLEAVENTAQYGGEISGVLDEATAKHIQFWLQNDWRCPAVVEAHINAGTVVQEATTAATNSNQADYETALTDDLVLEHLWLRDDPEVTMSDPGYPPGGTEIEPNQARMFVTDFSDRYSLSATDVDIPPFDSTRPPTVVLGQYVDDGPVSYPRYDQTWADGEILPEHLVADSNSTAITSLTDLLNNDTPLSTYKVIRAVSEVECLGFFDSVNAYDSAVSSVGPCHWTLTTGRAADARNNPDQTMTSGELPAYFSYLNRNAGTAPNADGDVPDHNDGFEKAVGQFGVGTHTAWGQDGGNLYGTSLRTYNGTLTLPYFDSVVQQGGTGGGGGGGGGGGSNAGGGQRPQVRIQREEVKNRDRDYFRTWHWFYRWVTAGRTVDGYREGMWDMARMRLRDLRNASFPNQTDLPSVGQGQNSQPATVSDVYTSERAMALLLRWHIRAPAHVVSGGDLGSFITGDSYTISTSAGDEQVDPTGAYHFAEDLADDDSSVTLTWDDPTQWGDDHEEFLAEGIVDAAEECATLHEDAYDNLGVDRSAFTGIGRSIRTTNQWPNWDGWRDTTYELSVTDIAEHERGPGTYSATDLDDLLSTDRDSFDFDDQHIEADSP